jgi:glycosyltransferase involved in cell wall biosynthesis
MRIAYLGQMADVSCETSIAKKIRSQCLAWIGAGHTVRYFALAPSHVVWPGLSPLKTELIPSGGALGRLLRAPALCRRIRAWQPDLIYFRYAYHAPGLPALFRDFPTVAEINSDDQREYPLTLGRLQNLYHRFTRHRVLTPIRGFVPVTHELTQRFASFGQPSLVVANSIDLDSFASLAPADPSAPVRLAFLGSPGTPWHGLDRLGELASLLPHVIIDIIGCTRSDWTPSSSPPPNLIFHGHLTRDRYEPLLRQATAALGTFGLYRKGMHEACPLKVREYLALGLPVITAYEDTDIPPGADYCLRLPNDNASLTPYRTQLISFIERWRSNRVPRSSIAHLNTSAKEALRLAFLASIATGRPPQP